jgi:perosamine synthetase
MNIFNSLGSNYNLSFALKALFAESKKENKVILREYLESKYKGEVYLVYKGREALRLALKLCDLKGSTVGICGFTCYAVYEAIAKEGYNVEYIDIEKDSLNFSAETLKRHIKENRDLKIVFIQNTLGYPCDILEISKVCKENNIILLEDLAHSVGSRYSNGSEAGTVGDLVMLSFSQDKIVDNVSGGALVIRNQVTKKFGTDMKAVDSKQKIKDRIYPLMTYKIRKLYGFFFGKILHRILKTFNFLSRPMEYIGQQDIHDLPVEYCREIYSQFLRLDKNIDHRKKIAEIYKKNIDKRLLYDKVCNLIDKSSNLRFPIFVEDRDSLVSYLRNEKIFLSDIWYDAPVAPRKYMEKTEYKKGSCPNSERVSKNILNLPTHRNISIKDAELLSRKINIWLQSL